ncbi:PREDICTED: plant UBX domain-containing protein 12-like isoform X2 [Camelina sativa]|uniref:Plant UBX domain-containing protein 12-like isoform X2 n=1 Tax=Camelina sativa TaxID=90675 RepID=A0ABM0XN91_CAMSA|nr:PREDICTED: plant UBX domain-containing protein 12-like isoform X2 [Camelina sativa]
MLECQSMMEKLSPFMDMASLEIESLRRIKRSKRDEAEEEEKEESEESTTSSSSSSSNAYFGFPHLPEEPTNRDFDQSVLCRIRVRLPDGRITQRSFLKSESVQLLWSYCNSQIDESERKLFKLIQAFPGDYKTLHYGSNTTFEQSGLANSVVSVSWV